MALKPIYTLENVRPVSEIRYDWSGWLRNSASFPSILEIATENLNDAWGRDGLTLETFSVEGNQIQCLFRANQDVSPSLCAARAKGRLQNELRTLGTEVKFDRRVSVRALGDNTTTIVQNYIRKQVGKSDYIDPRFKDHLGQFTVEVATRILENPSVSGHGRYWYNLHVVIVVQDRRYPITRNENFAKVSDTIFRIAKKKSHAVASAAVMPDHIHIALRANHTHTPSEVALAYLNNLSYILGYNECWSTEFYVGTFSEYDVRAVMH